MTGKKNKRGDRGSTEEETNAVKRSNKERIGQEEVGGNMADNDEVCDAEPTLYDIRNMLEDLQKSVSSILKENAILREDLTQLKSSLQSKEREVSALKTSFGKVSKANELTLCMSTRSKISIVIKIRFRKPVGLQGKPPFLSFFVRVQFQSPPTISVVNSDWSIK